MKAIISKLFMFPAVLITLVLAGCGSNGGQQGSASTAGASAISSTQPVLTAQYITTTKAIEKALLSVGSNSSASSPVAASSPVHAFSIYWTALQDGTIKRANDDGTGITTVLPYSGLLPFSLALNSATQQIYFVSYVPYSFPGTMAINRINYDGTGLTTLVSGIHAAHPGYIALDVAGGKMYWSTGIVFAEMTPDAPYARIMRANLDGTGVETIVTATLRVGGPPGFTVTGFQAVALDAAHGKVYWADYVDSAIMRANLDGSAAETVFSGFNCPNGLALDLVHGVAYFSNQCEGIVLRANLDGTGSIDQIAYLYEPYSIAVNPAGGHFYVAQPQASTISQANLDGTGLATLISDPYPYDVALDLPTPAAQVSNLELIINSFNLPGGTVNSLDAKLNSALADLTAGNTSAACNVLGAFSNEASAQSGKKISTTQANQLIAAALGIQAAAGCP